MVRLFFLKCCLLLWGTAMADTIVVKNIDELKKANAIARPGDIIILQNGEWQDVKIVLSCAGTNRQPIYFKAQDAGKVLITGNSQLKIGGSFIVVDGFYFTNGYAGDNAIIDFKTDKKQVANNCRVTNTVINDFNNPKRMDENYWVSMSGKNNRVDHCSFLNKKNMGVLMAVLLDDERSRENFHSIDHNYFGVRLPLASNSGEIIRVGVSQHCEFNSNTQITDNFFEHCDGETEIISIKSGSNIVRNNLFNECQGSVVLRHGNYNTVENNIFLGNDKDGTGGVRVINKGQWVVNNLFYKCRGTGFRSPLAIMNGVPNSPAFRYVAVTGAVIANNSFFNCAPISLCEGSDTERTVQPSQVAFANNIFYNDRDKLIYNSYDDINGFEFSGNAVSKGIAQQLAKGFTRAALSSHKAGGVIIPGTKVKTVISDSLRAVGKLRLKDGFPPGAGFGDMKKFLQVRNNAYNDCGAKFTTQNVTAARKPISVDCKTTAELKAQLTVVHTIPVIINLSGVSYISDDPFIINGNVTITSHKKEVHMGNTGKDLPYLFEIRGGSILTLSTIVLDLSGVKAKKFITADMNGSSGHSCFSVMGSTIKNLNAVFFNATKSTMFDSIIINNNSFSGNKG
ncbi:MAG TPA: polysaccharide lyase 6 family protein, partial [Ferruginibacter sp.]|nr:polysaccharide lyase 6 family protein [Ferruginibacter sp.]